MATHLPKPPAVLGPLFDQGDIVFYKDAIYSVLFVIRTPWIRDGPVGYELRSIYDENVIIDRAEEKDVFRIEFEEAQDCDFFDDPNLAISDATKPQATNSTLTTSEATNSTPAVEPRVPRPPVVAETATTRNYQPVSDKELEDLADSRHEKSTKKSTSWAVKAFKGELNSIFHAYLIFLKKLPANTVLTKW